MKRITMRESYGKENIHIAIKKLPLRDAKIKFAELHLPAVELIWWSNRIRIYDGVSIPLKED